VSAIVVILVLAAGPRVTLDETCQQLDLASAVDQAFLEALPTSGIPYRMSKPNLPCFADADETRVNELQSKVAAQNPQACLTFEKAWNVTGLEAKLRDANVPVWRPNTSDTGRITICHLKRVSARVKSAVQEVFPGIK
jgi:hypothetical protein